MGFYLRKSFRAGPVRLNLSKSGFGASAGVKGLRIGKSSKGRSYVHAGRGGLYYRKNLGSKKNKSSGGGIGYIIIFIIGLVILVNVVNWLIENPAIPITIFIVVGVLGTGYLYAHYNKLSLISRYKSALDKSFITNEVPSTSEALATIADLKIKISGHKDLLTESDKLERQIYSSILDKILDDNQITVAEQQTINAFESISSIDGAYRLETKKEIFRLLYLDVIADHRITKSEWNTINNIAHGLGLTKKDLEGELKVINEIREMQQISLPLLPVQGVPVKLQKTETAYYSGSGKILSRKKTKKNDDADYTYTVRRDGKLLITDKRILVIDEGQSTVKLKDILDIDVDIDKSMIVITKNTTSTPTFIQADKPLVSAKIADLMAGQRN